MDALETQVRDRLRQYVDGQLTVREFQDWFIPNTWDIDVRLQSPLVSLYGEIELRFAEYTNGHLTEPELRDLLTAALQQPSHA